MRLHHSASIDKAKHGYTHNLATNIVGFRGFHSSITLISRGGILMSIGDFLESLSQARLAGTMLVGRLGVQAYKGQGGPRRAGRGGARSRGSLQAYMS